MKRLLVVLSILTLAAGTSPAWPDQARGPSQGQEAGATTRAQASSGRVPSIKKTTGAAPGTAMPVAATAQRNDSASPVNPDNYLTITERAGVETLNYPVQIGRPFAQGEIADAPLALVDGVAVPTQANVKTRWPDGSVRHAILAFLIPDLAAGATIRVQFANQTATSASGLTAEQMLAPEFDFDAIVQLSGAATQTASARRMLTDGAATTWIAGPVATSLILADHSAARAYDIGGDANRAFRPIIHATFWPTINKVHIRVIGEIANTEAVQDEAYDLTISAGAAAPAVVYQKAGVKHPAMTRWTKEFWIGGAPGKVQVDHNIAYLAATTMLPNYDPARKLSEKAIASAYATWTAAKRDILQPGNWATSMGMAGGRSDIGPHPTWTVRWLFGGDPRMAEMAFGNADLFSGFPVHFREGQDKQYIRNVAGSGLGKPASIMARPTLFLYTGNAHINDSYTKTADKIRFSGPVAATVWVPENSHQPGALYPQYLLTGDYWYLEEMMFWVSWNAAAHNPDNVGYGRGPAGYYGGIVDEVRGQAWELRTRAEAWAALPDGTPEKQFVELLTNDALAIWEGSRGIHGAYDGTDLWKWGNKVASGLFAPDGASPQGWWEKGMSVGGSVDPSKAKLCTSPWMQHFLIYALGRAGEIGFQTGPLLEYASRSIIGELTTEGNDPHLVCAYRAPTTKLDGTNITNWKDWADAFLPHDAAGYCAEGINNVEHSYPTIAMPAAAMAYRFPNGDKAWAWIKDNVAAVAPFDDNPKWAILPRQ